MEITYEMAYEVYLRVDRKYFGDFTIGDTWNIIQEWEEYKKELDARTEIT